ncbi:MAG: DUF4870 domain-containing protein [Actinobacteria bacterium]|nr:DUF4870 domain-containing protein [Actinomycetota bacterium]MTA90314.1 DUF4870 domain-containing protein [Actinomycetota bacterium]
MSTNPYASEKMSPESEKLWSVALHLLAIPFEFFAPLIGYFLLKDKGPFVSHHAKESLNFGITILLAALVLVISIVGWLLLWALPIVWIVFRLIAAFKAGQGEFYKIPIAIKFIKV